MYIQMGNEQKDYNNKNVIKSRQFNILFESLVGKEFEIYDNANFRIGMFKLSMPVMFLIITI